MESDQLPRVVAQFDEYAITLIQLGPKKFCVRKRWKGFFTRKIRQSYFCMNRNGTDLLFNSLCDEITVAGEDRAKYVFNANLVKEGWLDGGK